MSRTSDIDALIRGARKAGLNAEPHGSKWRVTNPDTGGQVFVPPLAAGRALANIRADLKRLASPPSPMVGAVASRDSEDLAERAFEGWDLGSLMKAAETAGVKVRVSGGLLLVTGPPDAEPLACLLRNREAEILALLNPSEQKAEPDVPKVRDIVHLNIPDRPEDVAKDAEALWEIVRERAREQGDKPGTNAGVPGVLWSGAMNRVIDEFTSGWDTDYRKRVASYLEQSGHTKCQRRDARPPVWWIRDAWDDGGLKVTRKAPTPKVLDRKTPTASKAADSAPIQTPSVSGDAMAFIRSVDARIQEAEQRADKAEARVSELEGELATVRSERDAAISELDTINALFRRIGGGA